MGQRMNPASLLPDLPAGARILILRLRSIGDIILLTPTLRLLKEWRPDLRISVMVESRFCDLLQGNPAVEEILTPGKGAGARNLLSRLAVIRGLRSRDFSLCVNLHGGPTSRLFARWSGAPWRVGFAHYRRRKPLQHSGSRRPDHFKPAVSAHGGTSGRGVFLPGTAAEGNPARPDFLRGGAGRVVGRQTREPGDRLGTALRHRPSHRFVQDQGMGAGRIRADWVNTWRAKPVSLPYIPADREKRRCSMPWRKPSGAPLRRLEGVSLAQFAAALAGARLFVGNDSGPAHMAAALARPVVVIFGSSSSPIWGPWPRQSSTPATRVVQNPFDCNPCPGDRCYQFARPECILSVTFDQVKDAVEEVLAQSS